MLGFPSPESLFSPTYFQFSSVQLSSVQISSVQTSSVQFSSWQYFYSHISLFISVQFNSVQISSVQFSSVQFGSVQFSYFMPKRTGVHTYPWCFEYSFSSVRLLFFHNFTLIMFSSVQPKKHGLNVYLMKYCSVRHTFKSPEKW